nr:hypothetical protein [Tanacetum cinerariifolium]
MWLVDDFDAWNAFPWGEYMWDKIYQRTLNVVSKHTKYHLAELKKNPNFSATYNLYGFAWAFKLSNPNVALISSPEEMRQSWFMTNVDFIKGLADQDVQSSLAVASLYLSMGNLSSLAVEKSSNSGNSSLAFPESNAVLAVASLYLSMGNLSSLAVEKSSDSGNSSLAVGML